MVLVYTEADTAVPTSIRSGEFDIVVKQVVWNQWPTPRDVATKARGGYRMGDGEIKDTTFLDGLKDADTGKLMGAFAQEVGEINGRVCTREAMDAFAIESAKTLRQHRHQWRSG